VKPHEVTARIRAPGGLHIGLGIDNISIGGAFVRCNTVIPVGSSVSLEITRASARPMVVPAKVTTCVSPADAARTGRPAGVGLVFLSVTPHIASWLTTIVAEVLPKPVAPAPPVLQPVRTLRANRANRTGPSPFSERELTQPATEVLAGLPSGNDATLQQEISALRAKVMKHEALISDLVLDIRKLKSLYKGQR
jgi:hypothetical protein